MSPRSAVLSTLALGIVLVAGPGQAQQRQGAQTGQTPDVLPPSNGNGASGPTDAPPPEKKAPAREAAGYAYGDKPTILSKGQSNVAPRSRYRGKGPVVNLPGFEQTADGGSRLFVQLSQNVPVEERKTQGGVTYVLKGASPRVWNNTNALVTVHFNTPVARARLVPQGADLHFIVELRAASSPTWKMNDSPDRSAMLSVDFPKGDWLQVAASTPVAASDAPNEPTAPSPRPAAPARRGRRAPEKTTPKP